MGSVDRRLHALENKKPFVVGGPADEELPIERWVEELLASKSGPSLYGREEDEWINFRRWVDGLGFYLTYQLCRRIASARGEQVDFEESHPHLSEKVIERIEDAAEQFVEHWRRRYEEAVPQREAKRRLHAVGGDLLADVYSELEREDLR